MIEPSNNTSATESSKKAQNNSQITKSNNKSQVHEEEDGYVGSMSDLEDLPQLSLPVRKRINALKNIQLDMVNIETKFYEELHQLECKYVQMYDSLYEQRSKIVNGDYEPTVDESKWKYHDIYTDNKETTEETEEAVTKPDESVPAEDNKQEQGIPDFWLQAFKNTDIIGEAIQEHDEPVLKCLKDVKCIMNNTKPYGYTLEFHFGENEFFTNKILTKTYELSVELNQDDRDPLSYDGPIIYRCQGSKIEWNKGKDVTVKVIKKKQKHKATGTIRVVNKEEKQDSFFNFFDTPTDDGYRPSYRHFINGNKEQLTEENDEVNDEEEQLCEADFEMGHFFKEFLIPRAVLYYTGELTDVADDYEDEYDDEEEEGDAGDSEEEEEDDLDQDQENSKTNNKVRKGSRSNLVQRTKK